MESAAQILRKLNHVRGCETKAHKELAKTRSYANALDVQLITRDRRELQRQLVTAGVPHLRLVVDNAGRR